jgi:TRAP-type mannitol/chloroaromatic compound transport system permease small subunit
MEEVTKWQSPVQNHVRFRNRQRGVERLMSVAARVSKWIDSVNEWIGRGVAWATLGLVLVVFVDVLMRYLFNTSFVFTQELEWHVFSFVFLLGAGYTLLYDGHVRVDIVYQAVRPKTRAWIDLLGVIFFLIPGCLLVIDTSAAFAWTSLEVWEGSPDPGGIPFRFIVKGFIPAGFLLLLLQGISLGIKSLLVIGGTEIAEDDKA